MTRRLALRAIPYDLAVVALDRLEIDPFAKLRNLVTEEVVRDLPLIAYVPGELSQLERARLDAVAKAAVIAVVDSPEFLADLSTACTCTGRREPCRTPCADCSIA